MKILGALVACAALIGSGANASDTKYPDKPIKIVVPWAAGSSTDITTRVLANHLEKRLGQAVVVENRPGAEGVIGVSAVSRAKPDGYTLLMGSNGTHGANSALHPDLAYDPVASFDPIIQVSSMFYVLLTGADSDFSSISDALDKIKKSPDSYAMAGTSGISLLTGQLFSQAIATPLMSVPYKDVPQALMDLSANRVHLLFLSPAGAISQIKSGRLKALGITSKDRSKAFPGTPTLIEAGVKGFTSYAWIGLFGPAGMPPEVTAKLNREINAVLKDEKVREDLVNTGTDPESIAGGSSELFRDAVHLEIEKWKRTVANTQLERNK